MWDYIWWKHVGRNAEFIRVDDPYYALPGISSVYVPPICSPSISAHATQNPVLDSANAIPNSPEVPSPVYPSINTGMALPVRTEPNVGSWSRATELVQEGNRAREEEARKRVEEREAAGIELPATVFKETWKQVGGGATRQIVRLQKPEAAAGPSTPAKAVPPPPLTTASSSANNSTRASSQGCTPTSPATASSSASNRVRCQGSSPPSTIVVIRLTAPRRVKCSK